MFIVTDLVVTFMAKKLITLQTHCTVSLEYVDTLHGRVRYIGCHGIYTIPN